MTGRQPPAEQAQFRDGKVQIQDRLSENRRADGKVECLGILFDSDEDRYAHFLQKLRKMLPELRKQPDFPKAEDEDILSLSDPPYYTACPNPFLTDFVERYGSSDDSSESYHREPFALDVSEGKTHQLYKAHSYHTKVPHLAIVPSILHYSKPGDIVLDGFCGSGMTGVAAQWCGTAPPEYRRKIETQWEEEGRGKPEWGIRRAILGDLSPAATFIAANYNLPFDTDTFAQAGRHLLNEVEGEIGWMYETLHTDGKTVGRINYTVWSEVFSCPECGGDIVFVREALDQRTKRIRKEFPCPLCAAVVTKRRLNRMYVTQYDAAIDRSVKAPKRTPVLIDYTVGKRKYEKEPDEKDLEVLRRIEGLSHPADFPIDRMMHAPENVERWGDEWRAGVASFTHIHHLFLPRAARAMATLWRWASKYQELRTRHMLLFFVEQAIWNLSVLNRYRPTGYSQVNQYLAGRIRILSQHAESSPWYILGGKLKRLEKAFRPSVSRSDAGIVTTGDCARLPLPENSVDYVFTDPPYGDNLAYAELNFITEAFLRVFTNVAPEAIISETQKKGLLEYQHLMQRCFEEYHRVLKPGRWMTVVFHNSKGSVWNAIQEAILAAGFVVADVRTLDKQQGTFNQITAGGAVKQDLVISTYKPNRSLEEWFKLEAGTEGGVWQFITNHLSQVPIFSKQNSRVEIVAERQGHLLFDRMVAYHVQRGVTVPFSKGDFMTGLAQRFPERDDMYFLPEQVGEYDRRRRDVKELAQLQIVVTDEASAIQWLRQEVRLKPQTFQELHPNFMKEIVAWQKHERPVELKDMLRENFARYDGEGEVPAPIHAYLKDDPQLRYKGKDRWYVPDPKKAGDLEKIRERQLLKEFATITSAKGRVKQLRTEAARVGFKTLWEQGDYRSIVDVASKLPTKVVEEDPHLLMYVDLARSRLE